MRMTMIRRTISRRCRFSCVHAWTLFSFWRTCRGVGRRASRIPNMDAIHWDNDIDMLTSFYFICFRCLSSDGFRRNLLRSLGLPFV